MATYGTRSSLKGGATRADVREGAVHIPECKAPEVYVALKQEYLTLRRAIYEWAQEQMPARKDVVLHGWGAWPAWQVIMHMANHMTHHLGQISTILREAGCVSGPEHALYFQGIFVDASVNDPRVRGDGIGRKPFGRKKTRIAHRDNRASIFSALFRGCLGKWPSRGTEGNMRPFLLCRGDGTIPKCLPLPKRVGV